MAKRKAIDWEAIEREFRLGQLSLREIARQFNVDPGAISRKSKEKGWKKDLTNQVRERVRAELVNAEINTVDNGPHARAGDDAAIAAAAARSVEVVQAHRTSLGRVRRIADEMARRVEVSLGLAEGDRADRVPMGERETVADVMDKVAKTLARVVPLEREAFNLNEPGQQDPGGTLSPEQIKRMAREVVEG